MPVIAVLYDKWRIEANWEVHGAGRQPSVEGLNLEEGVVEHSEDGIVVNAFLQSTSNPAVGGGVATGAPA